MAYEPREDSYLLLKHLKTYVHGSVLDMGTGTGILAQEASKYATQVLAVDIDPEAIAVAQKQGKKRPHIRFVKSDLFSHIKGTFDTIIFNPPYLPTDARAPDIALDGGKKGWELIERFLHASSAFLKPEGNILLLFSSLTNKAKVDMLITNNLLVHEEIDHYKCSFEKLYVYRIYKTELLKRLEKQGLSNIHFLTKGHRGYVYTACLNRKKVIVKAKNPHATIDRIKHEGDFLKRLQRCSFVPKLYSMTTEYLIMEYIDGAEILDFLADARTNDIASVLKKIFEILLLLDAMKINKEEMHHPVKHILITKNKRVVFLDFERCRYTEKPKNVTQFCQFLANPKVQVLLTKKWIFIEQEKALQAARDYKMSGRLDMKEIIQ